jgi:hypothetical protein
MRGLLLRLWMNEGLERRTCSAKGFGWLPHGREAVIGQGSQKTALSVTRAAQGNDVRFAGNARSRTKTSSRDLEWCDHRFYAVQSLRYGVGPSP